MTPKQIVNLIRDELDSRQIYVTMRETAFGVAVSGDYSATLIAKSELRRRGILVNDPVSAILPLPER